MSLIERSTTELKFVDVQTPTRVQRVRVLGLTVYRRELRGGGPNRLAVSYLFGIPIYQTDGQRVNWQY